MTKIVIKRDGSEEPFDKNKFNRWAEYADKVGSCWSTVALESYKKLPEKVKSSEIHQTMIDVCIAQEDITFSRMAARLEYATIRKDMGHFGLYDKMPFKEIFDKLIGMGVWCGTTLPKFNPLWEDWYSEIRKPYLECWQIQQWCDKYALKQDGKIVETPHIGALGLGLAVYGDDVRAFKLALGVIEGKINLPTPVVNGCRNGDWDGISCCVITGGDSIDSIGVAEHIAYKMTAKKAGIGIEMRTRCKGDPVKGGIVTHLGKEPIFATVDKCVKMFTQVSRGGSATMTLKAVDADIERTLMLKTQRIPEPDRIDKLDYSFAYNDAFLQAVITDSEWNLFSRIHATDLVETAFYTASADDYNMKVKGLIESGVPHKTIKARDLLKQFLTARQETGRVYCINVSRANEHTPFLDTITLSNLCQEICLPTKPYVDMADLYSDESVGETAFCTLSAINVGKVSDDEYEVLAKLVLGTVDILIDRAPMMTKSMEKHIRERRSVAIGITGLAGKLYDEGFDYDGSPESTKRVSQIAERHYYYLLKASQELVGAHEPVKGIDVNWLPIDTKRGSYEPEMDWELLRGKPRRHSVLVGHMPTESSAVYSNALNGLYPQRAVVVYKQSRKGIIQFISNGEGKLTAWDVNNIHMARYYGAVQDWSDQAISADYYVDFRKFPDGKVPLSQLMKEWVAQAKFGVKTMYYVNSNDDNGGTFQDIAAGQLETTKGCEGGTCTL